MTAPQPIYRALGFLSAAIFLVAIGVGITQAFRSRHAPPAISIAPNELVSDMLARGDYARAAFELEASLRMNPERRDRGEMLAALGRALDELGRRDEAALRYGQAIEAGVGGQELRVLRVGLLTDLARFEEAADEYRLLVAHTPDDAELHNNFGYALERSGRSEAALEAYGRATALDPELAQAHFNLGRVRLAREDAKAAVDPLARAAALRPRLPDSHALLGDAQRTLGRLDEAEASYRRALDADPQRADLRRRHGELLLKMGRATEAASELLVAAERFPDDAVFLNNLAWLLATHPDPDVRSPGDAERFARRVIELDPSASSLDTLAAAQAAGGHFDAAIETADRAVERARHHADPALLLTLEARLASYRAGRATLDTRFPEAAP